MIVQGHHQPSKPSAPSKPTPHGRPSHNKPSGPSKPSKPSHNKPAAPSKPSKPASPGKKTAARNEINVEIEWIDFAPLAKGGHIH